MNLLRAKKYLYQIREEKKEIDELRERIMSVEASMYPSGIRYDLEKVQKIQSNGAADGKKHGACTPRTSTDRKSRVSGFCFLYPGVSVRKSTRRRAGRSQSTSDLRTSTVRRSSRPG